MFILKISVVYIISSFLNCLLCPLGTHTSYIYNIHSIELSLSLLCWWWLAIKLVIAVDAKSKQSLQLSAIVVVKKEKKNKQKKTRRMRLEWNTTLIHIPTKRCPYTRLDTIYIYAIHCEPEQEQNKKINTNTQTVCYDPPSDYRNVFRDENAHTGHTNKHSPVCLTTSI